MDVKIRHKVIEIEDRVSDRFDKSNIFFLKIPEICDKKHALLQNKLFFR